MTARPGVPGPDTPGAVRAAAAAAEDLDALAAVHRACTACPGLASTRTHVVPGVVPPRPRLLVVGEAPGATEDATGLPFVGRSGQLLDALLAEQQVTRAEVGVLNTVACRPPDNRPPTRSETATCRPWTERRLALVAELAVKELAVSGSVVSGPVVLAPVVLALGLSATRWFLGPTALGPVRGRVHHVDGARVVPTFHPSAALRGGPAGEPRRLLAADLALALSLDAPPDPARS